MVCARCLRRMFSSVQLDATGCMAHRSVDTSHDEVSVRSQASLGMSPLPAQPLAKAAAQDRLDALNAPYIAAEMHLAPAKVVVGAQQGAVAQRQQTGCAQVDPFALWLPAGDACSGICQEGTALTSDGVFCKVLALRRCPARQTHQASSERSHAVSASMRPVAVRRKQTARASSGGRVAARPM